MFYLCCKLKPLTYANNINMVLGSEKKIFKFTLSNNQTPQLTVTPIRRQVCRFMHQ